MIKEALVYAYLMIRNCGYPVEEQNRLHVARYYEPLLKQKDSEISNFIIIESDYCGMEQEQTPSPPKLTGLLILLIIVPMMIWQLSEPLQALFGTRDSFTIPGVTLIEIFGLAIVLGFVILLVSGVEYRLFHADFGYSIVAVRSKWMVFGYLILQYLLLAFLFAIIGDWQTAGISILTLAVFLVVIQWIVGIVSLDYAKVNKILGIENTESHQHVEVKQ